MIQLAITPGTKEVEVFVAAPDLENKDKQIFLYSDRTSKPKRIPLATLKRHVRPANKVIFRLEYPYKHLDSWARLHVIPKDIAMTKMVGTHCKLGGPVTMTTFFDPYDL